MIKDLQSYKFKMFEVFTTRQKYFVFKSVYTLRKTSDGNTT